MYMYITCEAITQWNLSIAGYYCKLLGWVVLYTIPSLSHLCTKLFFNALESTCRPIQIIQSALISGVSS